MTPVLLYATVFAVKHHPGSFTKNFAWGTTGLKRLHEAIRAGYRNELSSVSRDAFRRDCGINPPLDLIPINFFLHNLDGQLSVDELVRQAVLYPHSHNFDLLALFTFHLNCAGRGRDPRSRKEIQSRPAMWANEFVRDRLWVNGRWQASSLTEESLDRFLLEHLDATVNTRTKCLTNYRKLFELCRLIPTSSYTIRLTSDEWILPALFVAWDREILGKGVDNTDHLLKLVDSSELYKLLGITRDYALEQATHFVNIYRSIGFVNRLTEGAATTSSAVPGYFLTKPESTEEVKLDWLHQEGTDKAIERQRVERMEQKRDRRKSAAIKRIYNNECQFCGVCLKVSDSQYYSEAAHIRAVGKPHDGPDLMRNMLVLCPNHHLQFDRGILRLEKVGDSYRIRSREVGDPLEGKTLTLRHEIDDIFVEYHFKSFE